MNIKSNSSTSSWQQRVSTEMEVLSEIYSDAFKLLIEDKKCQINIFPNNLKSFQLAIPKCYVKIRIEFLEGYPVTMPKIELYKTYSLSKSDIAVINSHIMIIGKKCSEENMEMIHEICEQIQVIINKKAMDNEPLVSLNTSDFSNSPRVDSDGQRSQRKLSLNNNSNHRHNSIENLMQSPTDIIEGNSQEESPSGDDNGNETRKQQIKNQYEEQQQSYIKQGTSSLLYNHTYSRFRSDFSIINKLGQGGGGSVFKVQNVWDKMYYAIKRIKISITKKDDLNSILNTVRSEGYVLSRMQHPFIVRYYQTWVEDYNPNDYADECSDEDEYEICSEEDDKDDKGKDKKDVISTALRKLSCDESLGRRTKIEAQQILESPHSNSYSDCLVMFEGDENNNDNGNEANNPSEESSSHHHHLWDDYVEESTPNPEDVNNNTKQQQSSITPSISLSGLPSAKFKTLYIQMEFCEGKTLREAIDNRTLYQEQKWKLIIQILQAVNFIHSKKLIHRDIKPGNIFLDSNNSVKLGDFGLAKLTKTKSPLEELYKAECIKFNDNDLMTYAIGTKYYCSPEQEKQKNYDYKSDMFSIGIIIFEMFYHFDSLMERDIVLRGIKDSSVFPEAFYESNDKNVIEIVRRLTLINPIMRPKAQELLDSNLIPIFIDEKAVMENFNKIIEENKNYSHKFLEKLIEQKIIKNTTTNANTIEKDRDNDNDYYNSYDHYHSILMNNRSNNTSTNFLFLLMEKVLFKIKKIFHESNAFYCRLSEIQTYNKNVYLFDDNDAKKIIPIKKPSIEHNDKETLMLTNHGNVVIPCNNIFIELSKTIEQIILTSNPRKNRRKSQDFLPCKIYTDSLALYTMGSKQIEGYDLIYLNLWPDITQCTSSGILFDYDDKYIIDTLTVLFDVIEKLNFRNEIHIKINSTRILDLIISKLFGRNKEIVNDLKIDILSKVSKVLNSRDMIFNLAEFHKVASRKKINVPLTKDKLKDLITLLGINGDLDTLKKQFEKKDMEKEIDAIVSLFHDKKHYWKGRLASYMNKIKIDFSFIPNDLQLYSGMFIQVVYVNDEHHEKVPIAECGQIDNYLSATSSSVANEGSNEPGMMSNHGFALRFFVENIVKMTEMKVKEMEDYGNLKLDILIINTVDANNDGDGEKENAITVMMEIEKQIMKEKYKYEIIFRKQEITTFKEFFKMYRMKCLIVVKNKPKDNKAFGFDIKTRDMTKYCDHIDYSELGVLISCFSKKKSKSSLSM